MPNRRPGVRYPHVTTDAREADHSYCPVLEVVRARVGAGAEHWWELHKMPPVPDEQTARDAKNGLYRARNHTSKRRGSCGPVPLSIQADYDANADGTFTVWFRVTTRALAKAEIARRVNRGESLAYNVMRG